MSIMVFLAWGLLGTMLARAMRRESARVRREWRELTERCPVPGKTVEVVGLGGEILEQITWPPEGESRAEQKSEASEEAERSEIRRTIFRDAVRSSLILLTCFATVLFVGSFRQTLVLGPLVGPGVMFLLGGTLCAYVFTFYTGAVELLDHAYSESYGFIQGGGWLIYAMLGLVPAAIFCLAGMWMARIETGLVLDWSLGWASVYAAAGGIHWVAVARLMERGEEPSGRILQGGRVAIGRSRPVGGQYIVLVFASIVGMPLIMPAAIQLVQVAVRTILHTVA